jgi:hypothetical protein
MRAARRANFNTPKTKNPPARLSSGGGLGLLNWIGFSCPRRQKAYP